MKRLLVCQGWCRGTGNDTTLYNAKPLPGLVEILEQRVMKVLRGTGELQWLAERPNLAPHGCPLAFLRVRIAPTGNMFVETMHDRTSVAEGAIAEMSQQRAYVLIWIPEHLADNVCLGRIECPQRVELRTVHLQLVLLVVAEVLLNHVKRKVGNYETGSVDVFVSHRNGD